MTPFAYINRAVMAAVIGIAGTFVPPAVPAAREGGIPAQPANELFNLCNFVTPPAFHDVECPSPDYS